MVDNQVVLVSPQLESANRQNQKLGQLIIQKQIQNFNLKEALVISSVIIISGITRVLMQGLPSVEPIIFFAILAGWLFGSKKGFFVGATALWVSNFFVLGGQGPWTIFQAVGFGIAGYLGGLMRKKAKLPEAVLTMILATLIYEIIVNAGTLIFLPTGIFNVFILGLPFLIIHLVSNIVFSLALPKAKKFVEEGASFNEREIYEKFLSKIKTVENGK